MEKKLKEASTRKNILQLLHYREVNTEASKYVKEHCQFTHELIKRLGFEYELQGHQGCVNCLQWTSDGRFLASGSDDTKVMIWDPLKHSRVKVVSTNHIGNIFSVKFLGTNNSIIATAAGDCRVLVQSIDDTSLLDCSCHKNRVKRLAASPVDPTVFWSAGEDGLVMQYDLREVHECSTSKANLLISYRTPYEVKCVAVNPTKPHYIAVGANDAFVRMYDRRKIKTCSLSQMNDNEFIYPPKSKLSEANCVQYYAPGHLAIDNANIANFRYATTYIAFNSVGSEMLVNMGGEQIYLFDVNHKRSINEIRLPSFSDKIRKYNTYKCKCKPEEYNGYVPGSCTGAKVNLSKELCGCFYMRRAFNLYRRKWIGDLYCAARDYLYVTQNWPHETKAYIGLIKCLVALRWFEDARRWYEYLCQLQPEFAFHKQAQAMRDAIDFIESKPKETAEPELIKIEQDEVKRRLDSIDYELRFMGHCNTTTDIKEANFLGEDAHYICAGSDEGIIFIWERKTQSIVSALVGDVSIVNCIQPHPSLCLVASSGIDPVVKLWSPMPEDDIENIRVIKDIEPVVRANQHRMSMDPFESLLVNMGYQMQGTFINADRAFDELPHCRTS